MGDVGRPRIEIDKKQFEDLCGMNCTLEEIAGWFRCSEDTIELFCKREYEERFTDVYKKFSVKGKISLRRILLRQAETKPAVAIFLAKNLLGMTDKFETSLTSNDENKKLAQELLEKFKDGKEKE